MGTDVEEDIAPICSGSAPGDPRGRFLVSYSASLPVERRALGLGRAWEGDHVRAHSGGVSFSSVGHYYFGMCTNRANVLVCFSYRDGASPRYAGEHQPYTGLNQI